jgi:hypothetical protein
VDRLDTWLNGQRGWRRLAIIGGTFYLPTVWLGICPALCVAAFRSSGNPIPLPAIVAIAVLAIPAAVGFGSIMAVIHSRNVRNRKRKKGLPPFLLWRPIALAGVVLPTSGVNLWLANQDPPAHGNLNVAGFQLISAVIVIALAVENIRYSRRFIKPPRAIEPTALADE